ncbi:hypothetical protein RSOLAG1IB_09477 [Rhizoctonia solani AG-1 IB]|uniref:Uncharacterized protein n=1 Tax=Thanatephorus cucumeris (strain AG1-IB / isolate 7/3/14) TaxID=1108050 RepID=A0A0B7FVI2_THACB|nr:hypothetical protein RSOLAG1IB_09477 [Rhizoctonia solani AG-1 IB]
MTACSRSGRIHLTVACVLCVDVRLKAHAWLWRSVEWVELPNGCGSREDHPRPVPLYRCPGIALMPCPALRQSDLFSVLTFSCPDANRMSCTLCRDPTDCTGFAISKP